MKLWLSNDESVWPVCSAAEHRRRRPLEFLRDAPSTISAHAASARVLGDRRATTWNGARRYAALGRNPQPCLGAHAARNVEAADAPAADAALTAEGATRKRRSPQYGDAVTWHNVEDMMTKAGEMPEIDTGDRRHAARRNFAAGLDVPSFPIGSGQQSTDGREGKCAQNAKLLTASDWVEGSFQQYVLFTSRPFFAPSADMARARREAKTACAGTRERVTSAGVREGAWLCRDSAEPRDDSLILMPLPPSRGVGAPQASTFRSGARALGGRGAEGHGLGEAPNPPQARAPRHAAACRRKHFYNYAYPYRNAAAVSCNFTTLRWQRY